MVSGWVDWLIDWLTEWMCRIFSACAEYSFLAMWDVYEINFDIYIFLQGIVCLAPTGFGRKEHRPRNVGTLEHTSTAARTLGMRFFPSSGLLYNTELVVFRQNTCDWMGRGEQDRICCRGRSHGLEDDPATRDDRTLSGLPRIPLRAHDSENFQFEWAPWIHEKEWSLVSKSSATECVIRTDRLISGERFIDLSGSRIDWLID